MEPDVPDYSQAIATQNKPERLFVLIASTSNYMDSATAVKEPMEHASTFALQTKPKYLVHFCVLH